MNLHEYQSKQIFLESGMPVLEGGVAISPDEALEVAKNLSTNIWAVKAQVHAGGRGKVGGVKITKDLDEVKGLAENMLGKKLITKQTDGDGLPINHVYIEAGTEIVAEYYFSLVIDRAQETWTFIASTEGGMDIEAVITILGKPYTISASSVDKQWIWSYTRTGITKTVVIQFTQGKVSHIQADATNKNNE